MLTITIILFICGVFVPLAINKNSRIVNMLGVGSILGLSAKTIYQTIMNYLAQDGILITSFFQIPIIILGIAGAFHSIGYLRGHWEHRRGLYWALYFLTIFGMLSVIEKFCSMSILGILLAWEMMSLASAGLVGFDTHSKQTQRAFWTYLLASNAGAAFIMLMFAATPDHPILWIIFMIIGFGLKVGFPILHVWLPQAHPAAPAPVSAIMSGAMLNLGILGIIFFSTPVAILYSSLIGYILVSLGVIGSLGGILFALGQRNIKTLLAFSSIENMGIISMALGLFFITRTNIAYQTTSIFAIAGAIYHIINHSLLKGGLFLSAGSIYKQTGTLNMEEFGGLMKRMPILGRCFALNSVGICGIPPMNGFIGEFLIYVAAFYGVINGNSLIAAISATIAISLAFTGGLACAAFSKCFGACFMGEPRTEKAEKATEGSAFMSAPIVVLTILTIPATFLAPSMFIWISNSLEIPTFAKDVNILTNLVCIIFLLYMIIGFIYFVHNYILPGGRKIRRGPTWDCGFAKPTARMEYTGTAFAQPLVDFFSPFLKSIRKLSRVTTNLFPKSSEYSIETKDAGTSLFWDPIFKLFSKLFNKLHGLQSGSLHFYILVMVIAILAMLIWAFAF
jgi:formate hydrogenlyase subunit 3/multisubunit Na+/H+ antiporter MnhD subunit